MPTSKRDHLIEVACGLFYRHGFHATGIDTILAESGVAKMTLYKHFRSKDDLILATLRLQDRRWREWFVSAVEQRAAAPRERLLAMFDVLEVSFRRKSFCGCPFLKATSEFPALNDPVHQIAVRHQSEVCRYIRGLASEAGAGDPDGLAEQLGLLLRGAIATAQVAGKVGSARKAKEVARGLIDEATGG